MRLLVALSIAVLLCFQQAAALARSVEPCCHHDCMSMAVCIATGCSACPVAAAAPAAPALAAVPGDRHQPATDALPASAPLDGIWRPPQ